MVNLGSGALSLEVGALGINAGGVTVEE